MLSPAWAAPSLGSTESLPGTEPQLVHLEDGEAMLAWRVSQGACLFPGVLPGLMMCSGLTSMRLLQQAPCLPVAQGGPS